MEALSLFSKIYGSDGKDLIILHGLFGMGDNWGTHAKNFAALGYRVHAVDQRNHGRSPHHPDHNYELMADDLALYMDQHEIESAIILGHSMGGKTAMQFSVLHPNRVDALIVVDIAPKSYPIHHQVFIDAMKSINLGIMKSRGEIDRFLQDLIPSVGIRQFLMKSLHWKNKDTLAFRFNLDALEKQLTHVGAALEFGYYHGPTVFIIGGASGYVVDGDDAMIEQHFPSANIHTIPNAGHWVHAEAKDAFSATVMAFLNNLE